MLRALLICVALTALAAGCANGWPRVHNTPNFVHLNCVPTGSKINRNDCGTTNPGSSTSQNDLDRTQSPMTVGHMGGLGPPGK